MAELSSIFAAEEHLFADQGRFWALTTATLERVFGAQDAHDRVERYRLKVDRETPPSERLLVFHDSPLQIAADLAGEPQVTCEQAKAFAALQEASLKAASQPRDAA